MFVLSHRPTPEKTSFPEATFFQSGVQGCLLQMMEFFKEWKEQIKYSGACSF